jgi:predicted lactoylglutathione lyase
MFLTNAAFRAVDGPKGPAIVWLNLKSKQEVDELFERWKDTGAKILQLRVFYDFNRDMSEERHR